MTGQTPPRTAALTATVRVHLLHAPDPDTEPNPDLEDLVAARGAPAVLRSDNGPEFISEAMADWAGTRTGLSYIPPGSPWRNG